MFSRVWWCGMLLFGASSLSVAQGGAAASGKIVIVGASYAAGWSPQVLEGLRVVNRGVGGEETHQILARFERDVVRQAPSAVLIWGHINNIHRAPSGEFAAVKARIRADYQEMIRLARASDIAVILATEVTLSEPPGIVNRVLSLIGNLRGKSSYVAVINREVRDVNEWLRAYAAQQGIKVLDFERALDDGKGFRRAHFTLSDGSHISPAGYAALSAFARESRPVS